MACQPLHRYSMKYALNSFWGETQPNFPSILPPTRKSAAILSETCQLEHPIIRNQQITGLQISMHDHISMTSIKPTENLNHPPLNLTNTESIIFHLGLSDYGGQICPEKLENEHGIFVLALEILMQSDDVWRAPKNLQRFDFSESRLVIVNLFEATMRLSERRRAL